MSLSPNYNPKEWEEKIYQLWQENKVGVPEAQEKAQNLDEDDETYTILMPPPNLTGDLHAGHAFGHYLMDTITRVHRQKGRSGLWFPGVDHAGIQMEGVINKILKEQGKDRRDVTDEEFLEVCWQKAMEWQDNQRRQSSVLGDTPDYDRNLFTLDKRAVKMVTHAFLKYWRDGLLYKGSYLINWSVGLQTALSDVSGEIEYEKRKDPFVTFEYRIHAIPGKSARDALDVDLNKESDEKTSKIMSFVKEKIGVIKVSTVRPETIFGDVAIAIHSEILKERLGDSELAKEVFKLVNEGKIDLDYNCGLKIVKLIVSDKVDKDFGTGALKITPGHDPFDYELYNEFVAQGVLNSGFPVAVGRDGKLTDVCGEFAGQTVEESRVNVIKKLIESGYIPKRTEEKNVNEKNIPEVLRGIENIETYEIDWGYEHNVTVCERSKTVIEPLISEEFFLSYDKEFVHNPNNGGPHRPAGTSPKTGEERKVNLKQLGLEGVKKTNFYPKEFAKMGEHFVENLHDWCISRDLVWGHKMPIWYCEQCNASHRFGGPDEKIPGLIVSEITPEICPDCGSRELTQEKKILDTWFSSSLWPLSTLGYYEAQNKVENIVLDWFGVVVASGDQIIESTIEFIKEQKQKGRKIFYLSNAHEEVFENRIRPNEAFGLFDGGFASYQSKYAKPDEEFFDELIEKYDLDKAKTVFVDDHEAYTEAANSFGIQSFGYQQGQTDLKLEFNKIEAEKSKVKTDFEKYYPSQMMTTAKEIFYLWIVRMIILGKYFADEIPFEDLVITPTVLDGFGKKMSKSLKNGLEPVEAIEKFSSDALRVGMLSGMIPNRNLRFGGNVADTIMEKQRNFGNKIWNVARFFEYQLSNFDLEGKQTPPSFGHLPLSGEERVQLSPASLWILQKYLELEEVLENGLKTYELTHSIEALNKFLWDYYADWYVEYLKTEPEQLPFAYRLFKRYILTLSPYMPFETEVLWKEFFGEQGLLAFEKREDVMLDQSLNVILEVKDGRVLKQEKVQEFSQIVEFIENIRSVRGLFAIDPAVFVQVYTKSENLLKYSEFIKLLGRAELVNEQKEGLYNVDVGNYNYSLDILSYVKDKDEEVARTEKKIVDFEKQVQGLEKQLSNEKFLQNAEVEIVEEKKADLESRKMELKQQRDKMEFLN